MPFQKLGAENLDAVINVRVTAGEKEQIRHEADMAELPVSAFVRKRCFSRRVTVYPERVVAKEICQLCNVLEQVAVSTDGAYSEVVERALALCIDYLEQLARR